jgi:5-methyltetrahydropteroyltriglutamate--homocysteine methyltransferase
MFSNYHYLVPELEPNQQFKLNANPKPVQEFLEAVALGIKTRPVLLGPLTFLRLGKPARGTATTFDLLELVVNLVPVYQMLLKSLAAAGAEWVQIDEPIFSLDLEDKWKAAFGEVYADLNKCGVKLMVANYFGRVGSNLDTYLNLPVSGLHFDLVRAPEELELILNRWKSTKMISLGLVNGRNIWRTNLQNALGLAQVAINAVGSENVTVSPSCSLLHSPFSTAAEHKMSPEILEWLCFALEKLQEVVVLQRALNGKDETVSKELEFNAQVVSRRENSALTRNSLVQSEMKAVTPEMLRRQAPFVERYTAQKRLLNLPEFPTTTIGSFPQTKEVRVARQKFKKNEWSLAQYEEFIKAEVASCVRLQEQIGLDVLVHGESERNDMVEFFGENMEGYVFSENGWVQSYGSRCVKPPIIYGDVRRPTPMTVEMIYFAQSLTSKPMKGMLTGPVTMLQV